MMKAGINRRMVLALGTAALLAGCKVIPKGPVEPTRPPEDLPTDALPTDGQRHRVALLVPMSGPNGAIGQSIANATTMALLDTNAANLRITTYDTAGGAGPAASKAIADGNRLILGPLDASEVPAVASVARPARVPLIAYASDPAVAARDVFILGTVPAQSIERSVTQARGGGRLRYSALVPQGDYGQRASAAYAAAVKAAGGTLVATETYDRTNTSVISAARRVMTRGKADAVLVADGARIAALAAPQLKARTGSPLILGTELWNGESLISSTPALRGAWYSAVADARFAQFAESYRTRFGAAPYRAATMGYDSVLLTLRVARGWRPGSAFPTQVLGDRGGFLGLDGPFRFGANGVIERALEVRQVRAGGFTVVSPAPAKFAD